MPTAKSTTNRDAPSAERQIGAPVRVSLYSGGMDLQQRFVGTLSNFGRTDDEIRLRRDDFLLRLLVCDTVILKTARLLELRCLVEMLGVEGLLSLLKAGKLRFTCEAFAPAFQSPADAVDENDFLFICVWEGDRSQYVQESLAGVLRLGAPEMAALADEVPQYIAEAPGQAESDRILAHLRRVLRDGHPGFKAAIAASFLRETGRTFDANDLTVDVRPRPTGGYRLSTNLSAVSGLSREQIHTAVGRGASSFAAAHSRLEEMQRHHAIPGAPSETATIFAEHLDFVEATISPDRQAARLRRIIEIRDIPLRKDGVTIDVHKLIDVTTGPECVQFRSWLRNTDTLTEAEIREQLSSLVSRLGLFVRSPTGKSLRFLVNLGVGLGIQNPVPGLALGLFDTFVLEEILPVRGPIGFVDSVAKLVGSRRA